MTFRCAPVVVITLLSGLAVACSGGGLPTSRGPMDAWPWPFGMAQWLVCGLEVESFDRGYIVYDSQEDYRLPAFRLAGADGIARARGAPLDVPVRMVDLDHERTAVFIARGTYKASTCETAVPWGPLTTRAIDGTLATSDGLGLDGAEIVGCGAFAITDRTGAFVLRTDRELPCRVAVRCGTSDDAITADLTLASGNRVVVTPAELQAALDDLYGPPFAGLPVVADTFGTCVATRP